MDFKKKTTTKNRKVKGGTPLEEASRRYIKQFFNSTFLATKLSKILWPFERLSRSTKKAV